ncbi:hypothetical protein ASD64_08910 [Mesorhizobium sp. Root157]|uniref:DUF6950 family protein n=1 Tax=Mesorhizobium sp. Root157 TaxID=1736477 RepID=UPI0006F41C82|nr:hypothetical protein [Mesorhizobium sp. Root157]KQZ81869.1 hypothetical protein ASD64_08910 [Mesorhizobium sp. Root157]
MTRVVDWERRLKAAIQKHQGLPSQYGVSDCYLIADDAVEAVTGKTMFGLAARRYSTPVGAAKQLRKRGFETVEDAFAARFAAIPPTLAQRGDIGVIERNGEICGGVFTAIGFAIRDDKRVLFLPVSAVKAAFRVE